MFPLPFVVVVLAVHIHVYGAHASHVCSPNRVLSVVALRRRFFASSALFCCHSVVNLLFRFSSPVFFFFTTISFFLVFCSVVVFMISFICNCLEWLLSACFYLSCIFSIFSISIDAFYWQSYYKYIDVFRRVLST